MGWLFTTAAKPWQHPFSGLVMLLPASTYDKQVDRLSVRTVMQSLAAAGPGARGFSVEGVGAMGAVGAITTLEGAGAMEGAMDGPCARAPPWNAKASTTQTTSNLTVLLAILEGPFGSDPRSLLLCLLAAVIAVAVRPVGVAEGNGQINDVCVGVWLGGFRPRVRKVRLRRAVGRMEDHRELASGPGLFYIAFKNLGGLARLQEAAGEPCCPASWTCGGLPPFAAGFGLHRPCKGEESVYVAGLRKLDLSGLVVGFNWIS